MTMPKKVIYNGGTVSYNAAFDSPSCLVQGRQYIVRNVEVHNWYTVYELYGIKGRFNSVWFDDVKPVTFVFSYTIPKSFEELLVENVKNFYERNSIVYPITVKHVSMIGEDTYMAETQNTVYIVKVLDISRKYNKY